MRVAIIGAGYVGLSAGIKLADAGYDVYIFEKDSNPGGLAMGFREPGWDWALEKHYHHWFTSDKEIVKLADEIDHEIFTKRPKTSVLSKNEIYQFDSPLSLLTFAGLPMADRLRTGVTLAYLKATNSWKTLEKITAKDFLIKYSGNRSWNILWKPLFEGKFSKDADSVPASWFWARIKKRTPSLSYPVHGFASFAESMAETVSKNGGKVLLGKGIKSISYDKSKYKLASESGDEMVFDKVIVTLPTPLFLKVVDGLPQKYIKNLSILRGLGAVSLVVSLNKNYFDDGTYWLNINQSGFPFLALVEHTNFVERQNYAGERIIYVGNYLPASHEYFNKSGSELLKEFEPHLKRINPKFSKSWVNRTWVFKTPFAQPIIPLNYSKNLPSLETPFKGLYLANIQQVYPWDRGTNYAVELGYKVAELVIKSD